MERLLTDSELRQAKVKDLAIIGHTQPVDGHLDQSIESKQCRELFVDISSS